MKERRPSGGPVLAEVGPPVILSLDVAGYRSVVRTCGRGEGAMGAAERVRAGQRRQGMPGTLRAGLPAPRREQCCPGASR